jgi:hypothetical protein
LTAATTVFYGRHGQISAEVARPTKTLIMGAVILTALVLVTIAIGFRRRQWLALSLAVVSSVAFGVAVLSVTRVVGEINQYLLMWQSFVPITLLMGLGAAVLAPGATAPAPSAPKAIPALSRVGQAAAAIGVAGALTATALAVGQTAALAGPTHFPGYLAPAEEIAATKVVLAALRPTDRVVRFTITTQSAWPPIAGVALELERRGLRTTEATTAGAGVDPGLLFGASRHPTGHEDVDIQVQRIGPTEVQGVPAKGTPLGVIGSLVLLINRPAR